MDERDLIQLSTDGEHGVEGCHGLLENHGDLTAADAVNLPHGHLGDVKDLILHLVEGGTVLVHLSRGDDLTVAVSLEVVGIEADGTRHDLALRTLQQAHDRHGGHGLTAPRLTHHADGGVLGHVEGHAVYSLHHTLIRKEVGVQIVDLQDVGGVPHFCGKLGLGSLTVLPLFQGVHNLTVFLGDGSNLLARQI